MFFLLAAAICIFQPPSDWEIAQLKTPSPYVQIGFLGKGSSEFRPTLNFATEDVDGSLKEYVKAVKEIHLLEPQVKWRDLGKFATKAGEGRLTEISKPSPYGEMKVLQAIIVKDSKAYILTAAVLKQDFPKFQTQILDAFHSLDLTPDLWTPIADAEKRKELREFFSGLGQTEDHETQIQNLQQQVGAHSNLGPYWQFLALKEGIAKIKLKSGSR